MNPTVEATYARMREKLGSIAPDFELRYKAELVCEIEELKREKNAVILGHNYMEPALYHTVTDYCGDSLELARVAKELDAPVLVFCGVYFMAETAKILSPEKKVLIPSEQAGCSLAASITAADVRELKRQYPGVPVVSYVNCYAEVKAESDACCTSSNAAQVIASFGEGPIIFLPDMYLAGNVAKELNRELIFPTKDLVEATRKTEGLQKVVVGWEGKCEVHDQFTVEDIENVRKQFPDVVVLAHPECKPEVVEAADFSGSTKKMIDYVREIEAPHYLLLTECSMGDNIIAANPGRDVLRLCSIRCPHMNQITLEQTRDALKFDRYEVRVDEEIRLKSLKALDRMLAIH